MFWKLFELTAVFEYNKHYPNTKMFMDSKNVLLTTISEPIYKKSAIY